MTGFSTKSLDPQNNSLDLKQIHQIKKFLSKFTVLLEMI